MGRSDMTPADHIAALLQSKTHPLVLISGLPAAGKTTLAKTLKNDFENAVVVQGDWFIKHPTTERLARIETAEKSGDTARIDEEANPINWFDWPALQTAVSTLQNSGKLSLEGAWNQSTGHKTITTALTLPNTPAPIIVECAYLLHLPLVQQADLTMLIDTPEAVATQRLYARESAKFTTPYLDKDNFLAYREKLTARYDVPYFKRYRTHADLILKEGDEHAYHLV